MAQQQLEELHLVTVQHFLRIMGGVGVWGGELCLLIHAPYSPNIVACHLAMSQASHEVTYDCHHSINAKALYWLAHHISNWTKSKFSVVKYVYGK